MFFFFFGGVSNEVRRVVERNAARCLRCGSAADVVEYDRVLRAFFIPLYRWPGDGLAVNCERCGFLMPSPSIDRLHKPRDRKEVEAEQPSTMLPPSTCPFCSFPLSRSFKFCPQCGSPVTP